jgi:dienelactone hydrolase
MRVLRPLSLLALFCSLFLTSCLTAAQERSIVKSALLLTEVLPQIPVKPLNVLGMDIQEVHTAYDGSDAALSGNLYVPDGDGPYGAMLIYLGIASPADDPYAQALVRGLARQGVVVLVHQSSRMEAGIIDPIEVEGIVQAYLYLRERPEVDRERIGILGFSVGAGLALRAAADPRITSELAFLHSFGGYYDAASVLSAVTTEQVVVEGRPEPWIPDPLAASLFQHALLATVENEAERAQLQAALSSDAKPPAVLSQRGRTLLALYENKDPSRTQQILKNDPDLVGWLQEISPSTAIEQVRARLYIAHDHADAFLPFSESRALAEAAQDHTTVVFRSFVLFAHLYPTNDGDWFVFLREVWNLYWHVAAVLEEVA